MHDAVASGQRGAAGGIARKSEVDTLADCSERFGIQSCDRCEEIQWRSVVWLAGLRLPARIQCVKRVAAHELGHELLPGRGEIEEIETGDPAVNGKYGAHLFRDGLEGGYILFYIDSSGYIVMFSYATGVPTRTRPIASVMLLIIRLSKLFSVTAN